MNLIESFVRNPVKVSVGVILVMLFGIIALKTMPVQLTPEVQIPTLTIETRWPGASPQEVEREIVLEQEEQLQSVEGLRKLSSESMDSMGKITLEFAIGTNMQEALMLVNTRLQQVREYPENADEPVISTSNSSDRPIAWFILSQVPPNESEFVAFENAHPQLAERVRTLRNTDNPALLLYRLRELVKEHPEAAPLLPPERDVTLERRFAEDFIEARFERVDGVSNANVMGGREEEMQVVIDPQRLAARKLTIAEVRLALQGQNKDTSGGDFWEGKRRWVVRTLGQFRSEEQVANAILSRRDGSPIYVRDVADVRLGYKKPDGMVRRFGSSVIAINALRETGSNVLDVMEGLGKAVDELNTDLLHPRGLHLAQVYDETEYIHSSIGLVYDNIVEGAVLTFIALMLFLRNFRSSLVIFVSITVSMIGMFLLMRLMGRTLNVPSLAGIAFATGMLVDNFIVVLENIYRHYQSGEGPLAATVRGTQEVWGAVIAATLANLAVFIPVLFVQDEAGQLFRDIALATSSAVALSLLVALILVPTAASRILDPHLGEHLDEHNMSLQPGHHKRPKRGIRKWLAKAAEAFEPVSSAVGRLILTPLDAFGSAFVTTVVESNRWLQQTVLRRLAVICALIGTSVALSWLLLPKVEYLPSGNRNLVMGIMVPPPGYNIDQLTQMGETIEAGLKPYWDADPFSEEAKKLKYPVIGDFFYVARGRQLFLGVRAADPLRARELEGLIREVGAVLPGTFVIAKQTSLFESGLSAGRTVEVEITGPQVEQLVAAGGMMLGKIMMGDPANNVPPVIPGAQARPVPSLDLSSPEMHVIPKWEQAADMGVTAMNLGYTVDALVDGAYAADYYKDGDKIDLTIIGMQDFANRTQDLSELSIATPNGDLVPLSSVARVDYRSGPEQVNRRERQRAITIEVTPPATMPLEEAMDRIRDDIIKPMWQMPMFKDLPEPNLSGTADKLKTTWASLRWNLLLALVITYLLMAALFESWLYPFVIILSVPLGAVGGFGGLWCLNTFLLPDGVVQPLDVLTMLGFIILVGTVVNNPILIVEQALVHVREEGMDNHAAVLQSVSTRIRPIFMTALIGFFGLVPLVISPGAGSELYRGLGSVLLGGLLVSTVFTLFLVPSLFTLTLETKERLARLWNNEDEPDQEQPRHRKPVGETHVLSGPNGDRVVVAVDSPLVAVAENGNGHSHDHQNGHENGHSREQSQEAVATAHQHDH
jgi:HAE1 family hydrophobic/amphiphilic exporter-1